MSEAKIQGPDPILPRGADLVAEYARLKGIEREYSVTVKVVAVLAEIIQTLTNGKRVELTDEQLANSPSLTAWRDEGKASVVIETSRD